MQFRVYASGPADDPSKRHGSSGSGLPGEKQLCLRSFAAYLLPYLSMQPQT